MKIHPTFNWICLTPEPGNYTFGYYDRCPWDAAQQKHLAIKFPQQEHLPSQGETATVGYIDQKERHFRPLAETEAWCHQQGAMTLWLKHRPDSFIYNDFETRGEEWYPLARVYDLRQNAIAECYEKPIYVLSQDGRWGASLNFARIPRRGYSYARAPLPESSVQPDLDHDGLFLIDMISGNSTLIASYRQMMEMHPLPYDLEGAYLWLNHAAFNCDSSRLMVLFRQSHVQGDKRTAKDSSVIWKTFMYTMNLDGSDLQCSLPDIYWRHGAISHQIWGRTPREILVDADWCGRGHEYVVFDEDIQPLRASRISKGMGPMGHLIFSPDGQRIAADTYANAEGIQRLSLVNVATGKITELGRFRHQTTGLPFDVRCDLHPRWSADGSLLTVDSIHDGERKIYLLDMSEIMNL